MSRILVWDLPTRAFHWMFALVVAAALGIALAVDDDSTLFQIHMLLGLVAGFLVVLRLFWGGVGSRYARFSSFLFGPRALLDYLLGVGRDTAARHIGHNPGSTYALYAMLALGLGLAVTGPLVASQEGLEELHEIMAYALLAAVGAHLAGIAIHTIRHRENIAMGMIHGKKAGEPAQAIASPQGLAGLAFAVLVLGWSGMVFGGYDAEAKQLTLFGQTIRLGGEARPEEDRGHGSDHRSRRNREGRHDDGD
jgi:cytochrome b